MTNPTPHGPEERLDSPDYVPPFETPEQDRRSAWGLTALETHWRGYHFRSRTEARWACLFYALRIDFLYEAEGFSLRNGTRYLPDYYLPQVDMWAEVKGAGFTDEESRKCRLLAQESRRSCLMLPGVPTFRLYPAWVIDILPGSVESHLSKFLLDPDYHGRKYYDRERRFFHDPAGDFDLEYDFSLEYRNAVREARAERFGI